MATRVFLKNISARTTEQDLIELFGKYGEVKKIDLKLGFGFIFFDDPNEALEAIKNMDGKEIDGKILVVEIARDSKEYGNKSKPVKRLDLRLSVFNLDSRISWQDLKDWGREAGEVTFTNVFTRDSQQVGVVEFQTLEGMENALRTLEDVPLKGIRVRLEKEDPNAVHHRSSASHTSAREPYNKGSTGGGYRGAGFDESRAPRFEERDPRSSSGGFYRAGERGGYEGSRGGAMYGHPGERGYGGPPPPGYDHHRGGGYDDRMGYAERGRYSDDYRRGGPPAPYMGVPPPYMGGGRDGRSRSRSRERGDPHGRFYGGGGGGYGMPAYPPRGGYDAAPPRGYGGEPPRGPPGGRYYEGGRGAVGPEPPRGPR